MSDLRHQTPEELRKLIAWCERRRSNIEKQQENITDTIANMHDEIAKLHDRIRELGRQSHNIGQKETWARIWLARKETGQAS